MDSQTIITAISSTAAGSALTGYLAKMFFERLVRKQDDHERKFEYLIDRFSQAIAELRTKLAVLEVTVADAKNMRSDIKMSEKELAVVIKTADKAHKRIDDLKDGVARMHSDIERLEQSIGGG